MIRLLAVVGLLFSGLAALAAPEEPQEKKEMPPEVDVAKTTERIVLDANEAGKRLSAKDPGGDTQRLQKDVLKNIDALIRKAQEPPPMGGNESSMGGGMSKQPMGTGKEPSPTPTPSASRKERRDKNKSMANGGGPKEPQPNPLSPRPDPKTSLGSAGPLLNKIVPKGGGTMLRVPDIYKDIWGHLPEKMRQEMDLYFREQFMPRYSDLLRQYYSSLAERNGKTTP